MSKTIKGFEYIPETPERKQAFQKIKSLYDSRGTKSSTLSKFGDDSETIIS